MTTIIPGTDRATSSVQNTVSEQADSEKSRSILDKDAFLKLLITQLANQDPTNPMEDRDFIAQMAQFSSLEQMSNVANEIRGMRQLFSVSSNLIGKTIEWWVSGEEDLMSGVVNSILLRDGQTLAVVGEIEVPFDQIVRVSDAVSEPEEELPDDTDEGGDIIDE